MTYLLTAHITKTDQGDEIVGIDRPIPSKQELPLPFLVEETVTPGYQDISSIENWKTFALDRNQFNRDYIFIRERIKQLVIQKAVDSCLGEITDPSTLTPQAGDRYCVGIGGVGDWLGKDNLIAEWQGSWEFYDKEFLGYTLCNSAEKEIAMELYIGDPDQHDQEFGAEVAQEWREEYHEIAIPAREKRIIRAETLIETQLRPYQSPIMLLITSLVTTVDLGFGPQQFSIDLHKNYWRFGVLGTVEDYHAIKNPQGSVGIMDYIYGRSLFAGSGLIDMPWQPSTMTMPQLCDRVNEILVLGIY